MSAHLIEGIMPAVVTPFDDEYNINLAAIPQLIEHFLKAGVGGLMINGSSAEFLTLTPDERKALAERFIQEVAGKVPIIVHVGAKELDVAIDLAKHAKSSNASAIVTLPPLDRAASSFEQDVAWYRSVGEATDLPLYVYLRSDMGSSNIRPQVFLNAMKTVPNFAGIKFGDANFHILNGIRRLSNDTINLLTGPDELVLAGLVMRASHGAVGTTYNAFPNHFVGIYNDYMAGNIAAAEAKQEQAGELIEALIDFGIVLAGTKAIMREFGLPAGQCRPTATYGAAQAAHTESHFTDRVTDEQLAVLMEIVHRHNLR